MNKKELLDFINEKYWDAKKRRISRMSEEWGKWSAKMNRELRKRIESGKDEEELELKYIVIYWTIRSQMLELSYKNKFFGGNKIKKLGKEASDIKKLILTGNLEELSFEQAAKAVLR